MKKLALFAAALVLTFGLAQCKKEQTQTEGKTVQITVKVANSGSKANVDPSNGHITFNNGDKLYVGYNSACVGTLTYSGSAFSGSVSDAVVGTQPLYFYYLGGAAATVVDATHYSADISNQSSNYPVISYGTSTTDYTGSGSYETTLLNKCALVKFTLTNGTSDPVNVIGLNTKATIDFTNPGVITAGTPGAITLHAGASDTERWAILLPQAAATADVAVGYSGYTASVPAIAVNDFNTTGIAINNSAASNIVYLNYLTANYTATNGQTLTGTLGANVKISIADGATVTLDGVSINASGTWTSGDYAGLTCEGDAIIILSGENILRGIDDDYPGIHIKENKTLTIKGTGSLDASGNPTGYCYSAGIGGAYSSKCGNIVIEGGTITATGGNRDCAAIGGAFCGGYGDITISGGTVTATAVGDGAGIGSGYNSGYASGNITILGGTVTAMSQGKGAGIGSGYSGSGSVGNILISGGTITATGGDNAAGIGSGYYSSCGGITIESTVTSVTATKGSGAPNSIGAGNFGTCGTVTIGGVVTGPISDSPYTYPVPLTYPIALGDATSDYVGGVVAIDGKVYASVAAANVASTAVAIIAYVGTAGSVNANESYKGLAIALSDANSGSECRWGENFADCLKGIGQTSDITTALGFKNGITCTSTLTAAGHSSHGHAAATAAASNNGTTAPTGTSGWFMPSMGQWNLIVQGLATKKGSAVTPDLTYDTENDTYKANNLNSVITDAGGTVFRADKYWASTEYNNGDAWAIHFSNGFATKFSKYTTHYVRSVIAF